MTLILVQILILPYMTHSPMGCQVQTMSFLGRHAVGYQVETTPRRKSVMVQRGQFWTFIIFKEKKSFFIRKFNDRVDQMLTDLQMI